MKTTADELIHIATIIKSFGVKGEVVLDPHTDNINRFVKDYSTFLYFIDEVEHILTMTGFKIQGARVIANMAELDTPEQVQALRQQPLFVHASERAPLSDNEYYYSDLQSCTVYEQQRKVGVVQHVRNYGTCDLLEVLLPMEKKTIVLIPFRDALIERVDILEKKIVYSDLTGYLGDI